MTEKKLTWLDVNRLANELGPKIPRVVANRRPAAFGIPRGGMHAAQILDKHSYVRLVHRPEDADVFIDDIVDSGATAKRWAQMYQKPFFALIDKTSNPSDEWFTFPWEYGERPAEDNVARVLEAIGENPNREGLIDTPRRYIKMLKEFLTPEPFECTVFEKEHYDQMIVESEIRFHSFCEHHMIPFFGTAAIGYLPDTKIIGLSKLPRVLDKFARRLQNQERITAQVADYLMEELQPKGVGVVLEAEHLCVAMRGIKKENVKTTTSQLRGVFLEPAVKSEFFYHIRK